MRSVLSALGALLVAGPCLAEAAETYDLIFRTGTLDALSVDAEITYRETSDDLDDRVLLRIGTENTTRLVREQDGKTSTLASFKTSVGNPVIMYFMESAVRDVAELSGGSPFYIRNRFKDALLEDVPAEEVTLTYAGEQISAQRVVLHPLAKDANVARMKGMDDLALEITLSAEVPGWYYSLAAHAEGDEADYERLLKLQLVSAK
jgi:hypothetical protein